MERINFMQMNYIYIFHMLKECMDVSNFDIEIEDIKASNVKKILYKYLEVNGIKTDGDHIVFNDAVNQLIRKSSTEILTFYGRDTEKDVEQLRDFKKQVSNCVEKVNDIQFIGYLKKINIDEVKKIIKKVETSKEKEIVEEKVSIESRTASLLEFLF